MDNEFWKEIGVSYRELDSIKRRSYKRLRTILQDNSSQMSIFANHFGTGSIDLNDVSQLKRLVVTDKGRAVLGLFKYQKSKIDLLKEFFKIKGQVVVRTLPALVKLYNQDKEKIIDSAYYFLFNNLKISEIWAVKPSIPADFIESFTAKELSIRQLISRRLHRKTRLARKFNLGGVIYFFFERAKEESLLQGYNERVPLLKRAEFGISFDLVKNEVTLRSGDPRISDIFYSYFQDENLKVFVHSPTESQQSIRQLCNRILTYSNDALLLTEVTFNYLAQGINCRTTFKHDEGINNLLSPLIEQGFIDRFDYMALHSFRIKVGAVTRTIHVRKNGENISFSFERNGLVNEKFQEMANLLQAELGISLDTEYNESSEPIDKKIILQNMVGKYLHLLSPSEKALYNQLSQVGIVERQPISLHICLGCNKSYTGRSLDTCEDCQSTLREYTPRNKVMISGQMVLEYLKKRLLKIYGSNNVKITSMKNDKRKFLLLQHARSEIYFYPYLSGHVKKLIEKWEEEFIPSIQIILGTHSPELNSALASEIFLFDVVFQSDEELKTLIEQLAVRKYEQVIANKTLDSLSKAKKICARQLTVTGTEFEYVCYPLLRRILHTLVHWGVKEKFKPIPDGIYGIRMIIDKRKAFSFIYDCKYSDGTYNLNIAEKRKALDYCRRANHAKAVKVFSGTLSAYFAVTHNLSQQKFQNLVQYIKGYKSWKGKIVLLSLERLLELYEKFVSNYQADDEGRIAFNLALAEQIREHRDRGMVISTADISAICSKADTIKTSLDVQSVLSHLESNIDY